MPSEHSAGAIVFRKEAGKNLFLLLHYEEGHWGSSKGHTEKNETDEETARREIREETGINDLTFIEGFKELDRYYYMKSGERIFKTVTFLLAETLTKEIKISFEHTGYAWLPYAEAVERITYDSEKAAFRKAHRFLIEHNLQPG